MNCEFCTKQFVDDLNVWANYFIHKIVVHGEKVN